MNILIATTEAVPFAKTGGLADVCGALPGAISELGHEVAVIMPAFRSALSTDTPRESTDVRFDIPIGGKIVRGELLKTHHPDHGCPVYLVSQPDYYDRDGLYQEDGRDYQDNAERFIFFCRAVMEAIRLLDMRLDVIHCNDWQTGLIPAYLRLEYQHAAGYEALSSLLTIHNLAYQGRFWHWDMLLTGLDWKYFNWRQMEFFGDLNLLKTGIVFADAINTVSPTYASEIQTSEQGCGLEGVLQHRRAEMAGILNGVDYREWNPAADPHLAASYDLETRQQGKPLCKAALQSELGLEVRTDVPLLGLVGRLATQKGWDLVMDVMSRWTQTEDVQWAILGTGEPQFHQQLEQIARQHPGRVAAQLSFSNEMAHRIEAGADMFLMPSRYEPCGLNQMYSLKYGTIPVVRRTGGLADTVVNADSETLASGSATGFVFDEYDSYALENSLRAACDLFRDKQAWDRLVTTAMSADFSWEQSARKYAAMYEWLHGHVELGSRTAGQGSLARSLNGIRQAD